jgi:acetyl-CoA synthetase
MSEIFDPKYPFEKSNFDDFMTKQGIKTYEELYAKSVKDINWFWDAFVKHVDLEWFKPYDEVVDLKDGIQWPKWFSGGMINICHNMIDVHVKRGRGDVPALKFEGEDGEKRTYTYKQLLAEVSRLSCALKDMGFNKGDRVGIFMPMIPEIVIAMMAVIRLGGVLVPVFSGYGAEAIATRLKDCEARYLFTAAGFARRSKKINMKKVADETAALCPSLEKVIVVRGEGYECAMNDKDVDFYAIMQGKKDFYPAEILPSETPMMIIYTSGTTGKPKGTVHTHVGFPIKTAMDMYFNFDMKHTDTISWLTDMGWMMGPWVVYGGLLLGGTVFLYDGAPDYPAPDRLWSVIEGNNISIMGISPTLIRSIMKQSKEAEEYAMKHPMPSLKLLGSTGEPWNPEPWIWCFKFVGKERCPIINYSGGTEISGGIICSVPFMKFKPCSFHGPMLGIDADVFDENAKSITKSNQMGELVIKNPWIGMTRGFYKDPERYMETYWSKYKDVWVHGDLIYTDDEGYWYIHGRSDDTLKIAGKRVGPAEVESILVDTGMVAEAGVIGVPDEVKGEAIVCFAVLKSNVEFNDEIKKTLKSAVTKTMGKAFDPKDIVVVKDLPKTRNNKIMRRLIKAAFLGKPLGDISSLENPASLDDIKKFGEKK